MGSIASLETLLERYVAANDEAAMAELVARTRPRLLGTARRIWTDEAEDVVQSAYLSLVRRRDAAIRILHPLLLMPWLLADYATAAAVTLGGVMKAKGTGLAAALILIASVIGGLAWLATRDSDTARERALRLARHVAEPRGTEPADGPDQPRDVTADGEAPSRKAREQPPFAAGVVLDTAGDPIEGVRVLARVYRADVARRRLPEQIGDRFRAADPLARTGAGGHFRVDSVPPGLHSLVFLRRGFAAKEVVCAENVQFDRNEGVTHADVKRAGVGLRVVLEPGRSLTGVVETTGGQPLLRASVGVIIHRGLWQQTRTDEQGRFLFSGLPAGKYIVVAKAQDRPEVVREVTAPVQDLVLHIRPGATLVVATGVANTMIHVETLEAGRFRKQRTNADGIATFEAYDAPRYRVVVGKKAIEVEREGDRVVGTVD